jgi:aspartokinase
MGTISHDVLLRLAFLGSSIMQDRSVGFTSKTGVNFSIASSFGENFSGGMRVLSGSPCSESAIVGLTHKTGLVSISAVSEGDVFDSLFKIWRDSGVNVSFMRHTKLGDSGKFLEEIAVAAPDYALLRGSCFDAPFS